MISRYLVYVILFLSLPVLARGQTTIAEAIKSGRTLQVEWVQQSHLAEGGSKAGRYPLYPDQLRNGESEIRIGFQFSQDINGKIKGAINYISSIQFPDEWTTYPTLPPEIEDSKEIFSRETEPIIVDTRFREEYFNSYLFHFDLLQGISFDAKCELASAKRFWSAYQDKLEIALANSNLDEEQKDAIKNTKLPDTFKEENWLNFVCTLLEQELPDTESFYLLSKEYSNIFLVNNFYRIDYQPKQTILEGKIHGQIASYVRVTFYKQDNWLEFWADTLIQLNETGNFKLSFPLDYAQMISLSHGYKTMMFYLEPGDSLDFSTDGNAFYRQMTFKGTSISSQKFLIDFFHEMRGDTFYRSRDLHLLEQDQRSFLEKTKAREKRELLYLKDAALDLSPAFASYMDRMIRFYYAFSIWEGAWRFYKDKDLQLDPAFAYHAEHLRSLLYRLPPQKSFDFSIQDYLNFQFYRLNGLYLQLNRHAAKKYFLANHLLNKETLVRHYAMTLFRAYSSNEGLSNKYKKRLDQLLEICKDSVLLKELSVFSQPGAGSGRGAYSFRTLPTSRPAPDWSFKDKEGVKTSLSDFRGKKILLHIGWSRNLTSALNDVAFFRKNQNDLPDVVHLIQSKNKDAFDLAVLDQEGLFVYVPNEDRQSVQDNYRLDNTSNHYFVLDEKGVVIANNYELGTPTQMRGTWSKIAAVSNEPWTVEERLSLWRGLGLGVFTLLLVSLIYLWRKRITANREFRQRQLLELELKGIRAQMNPHFLFNAMSSIQNLIRKNEQEKADTYLSQFAGLMRRTLRNSREEFIPLSEELAMIKQYCSLEALRNPIQFEFEVDPNIDQQNTYIPSMLLQPIIENAIIHGLLPKRGHRELSVKIQDRMEGLRCTITDNGIGVDTAQTQKQAQTKGRKSLGLKLVNQRLALLSANDANQIAMTDRSRLEEGLQGTQVTLIIPIEQ